MGYDIYIGNTVMEPLEEDEWTTPYSRKIGGVVRHFRPVVKRIRLPDAPTFPGDEMTGNSNGRHPGYIVWADFCRKAGLYDLFFHSLQGLMRERPGHQLLKSWHAEEIEHALKAWKEAYPLAVPGFEAFSLVDDAPVVGYDPILARLIWLDWWVKWAIENCEHAGICNF